MKSSIFIGTIILLAGSFAVSCSHSGKKDIITISGLNPNDFKAEYNGKNTDLFILTNSNGMEVLITNFGGRIVSVTVPDKDGEMRDVVLGFDKITDYFPENNATDFGASIGRYANRINHGRFTLNGKEIQLPVNNYGHTLHGGPTGWQYQVYDVKEVKPDAITLVINSPDGDNNFPGNVTAEVTYTLTPDNAIDISYNAVTDSPTIINMTNHSYFNLSGDPSKVATDHLLQINASNFTPVDSTFMTTGEIWNVEGTPMDFRHAKAIGTDIGKYEYEQIRNGLGFDHNWVLDTKGDDTQVAAALYSPDTGIVLEVKTNEPGIQIYREFSRRNSYRQKGNKI